MTAPNAPEGPASQQPPAVPPVADAAAWGVPEGPERGNLGRDIAREILIAVAVIVGSALAGLLFGLLWHAVAPRVPLYSDGTAVYLRDPEGEQQIAADGTFVLIGACFGIAAAALAFFLTRRRGAGLGVPIGLALGGLAAGWVAWQFGGNMGPQSLIALAQSVPQNTTFSRPLQLGAKTALVAWPMTALLTFLGATTLFAARESSSAFGPEPTHPWPTPPQQ